MSTLLELYGQYETTQKELQAVEAQAETLRKQKSEIAQRILEEHGPGPHDFGEKKLVVSKGRGGTAFLREPPPKGKKQSV